MDAVGERQKPFEVRKDDRDFQVGDWLTLREWDDQVCAFGLRWIACKITYVLRGDAAFRFGVRPGFCVLGIMLPDDHQWPPNAPAKPRQDGGAPMSDPKPQEALAGADGSATGTESRVCQDIALRQRRGVAKYGFTVDGNPLHLISWLRHAYEECLDQAVYLRRAIEEIEKSQDIQSSNTKQASKMKS